MNKTKSSLIAAAVSGLLLGSTTGCGGDPAPGETSPASSPAEGGGALAIAEKHACKGLNSCKGNGGCKTADNACAGQNDCKGKGGCATVAHHACAGQNACKNQGGCGANKGKNECAGKGGCAVPIKH